MNNPFFAGYVTLAGKQHPTFTHAAADRVEMVKKFDLQQCRAALKVHGLQATVRRAVEAQIRKLEKEKTR